MTISVVLADADILLTENTKHFPRESMAEQGIELLGAGDLLARLAEQFPKEVRAAHDGGISG